jgi:hypothetical protein
MSDSIEIRMTGPLFDGRAERAIQDFCEAARDDIAEFGEQVALAEMGAVFKHPSGYYESQVKTTVVTPEIARVDDSGVVYGPWLAGVGSRNFPVTRFKGYDHWRKAKQAVQDRGHQIAEQTLNRHIGRMR